MLSYFWYHIISIGIPVTLALSSLVPVFIVYWSVGCDEIVRKVFPYVKKIAREHTGGWTEVFGYPLSEWEICILFLVVLLVVFFATFIFGSSFTDISYKYNPYDHFECFFSNGSLVQATPEEALVLEDKVMCFTWNFNIGKAMGQATGTLAFSWIFSSSVLWITMKLKNEQKNAKDKKDSKCCCCCCCLWLILSYLGATLFSLSLIAGGVCLYILKYTTQLCSGQIIACGVILILQVGLLILSDLVLCVEKLCQLFRTNAGSSVERDRLVNTSDARPQVEPGALPDLES